MNRSLRFKIMGNIKKEEYVTKLRNNIPTELQQDETRWMLSNEQKQPVSPHTGRVADVTNPESWASFEECIAALSNEIPWMSLVLHKDSLYGCVDFDNKVSNPATPEELNVHSKIIHTFKSYTEISVSGRGQHLLFKRKKESVPRNCRRNGVEVYTHNRHMVCTGDILVDLPIAERQDLLDALQYEMAGQQLTPEQELYEVEPILSDDEVLQMASTRAKNKEKFNALWNGRYTQYSELYSSQSEADHALICMLAFYTRSNEQVRRLFRVSELGQRDKALREDYIDKSLKRFRAEQPIEQVDFSQLTMEPQPAVEQSISAVSAPEEEVEVDYEVTFPKGLLGEIAQFCYDASVLPNKKVSLATAIAFFSGIAARAYNISESGLNCYIIVIGKTGTGKDATHDCFSKLFSSLKPYGGDLFHGSNFASGQGVIAKLAEQPCFVSALGEIGITLRQICDPKAQSSMQEYKRCLLELYSKSGRHGYFSGVTYSKKENNIAKIESPCLSFIGESTPERFYEGLGNDHIAEGLIPRFIVIENKQERSKRNKNRKRYPDEGLVQRLHPILAKAINNAGVMSQIAHNPVIDVTAFPEAEGILDEFEEFCAKKLKSSNATETELWNRAHLKALRLAGLVAVGLNHETPVVDKETALWACGFIHSTTESAFARFASGDMDGGSSEQYAKVKKMFLDYEKMTVQQRLNYGVPPKVAEAGIMCHGFLGKRLRRHACFKNDSRKPKRAISETIEFLIQNGEVIPVKDLKREYNTTMELYRRNF